MKATLGFAFFLLFLAGIAFVNLDNAVERRSAELRPLAADELAAERWQLLALRELGNVAPAGIHLQFTRGGLLTVEGACNRMTADYGLAAGTLTIDEIAATRRACQPEAMAADSALAGVLAAAATAASDGEQLVLLSGDGKRLARFAATPPAGTGH